MDSSYSARAKSKVKHQSPLEPKYLPRIKENRNNCYDNISVNIDRGLPGHPLEHEIADQESRENSEQKEDEKNYNIQHHNDVSSKPKDGPLEPNFSIQTKENRNNCYDNISVNIDRGMPGHPLESEIAEQERRELIEKEEDVEFYNQNEVSSEQKESPLEPNFSIQIKENRNNCYNNISVNIERGMPGNPLEQEMAEQEKCELIEQDEDYEYYLQYVVCCKPKEIPLEPLYLVDVKENHNNCYDNISVNIDRGMPGHPLEKEMAEQEKRESLEKEEENNKENNENNIVNNEDNNVVNNEVDISEPENEKPPVNDGVFMQLEVNEDEDFSWSSSSSSSDDSEKLSKVHPPNQPNMSPRTKKNFFSTYDPKIFYPTTDPKKNTPKIIHNKFKYPLKLKVSLKDIGLDGMDSVIPNKAAELFNKEKLKIKSNKEKPTIFSPTQTITPYRTQFRSTQNQEPSSPSSVKQSRFIDYSSDDSYELCNIDINDVDDSPPPPLQEITNNNNNNDMPDDDKPFALNVKKNHQIKISEPDFKPVDAGNRSPRRKKVEQQSTYDPSIFYTPFSLNASSELCHRAKCDYGQKHPIKLTVTLKEIGLEGLDSAVPSQRHTNNKLKARK